MKDVTVLIGAGSIGLAIARRVSSGHHVLIADMKKENGEVVAKVFSEAGFDTTVETVDISSREDVERLAKKAAIRLVQVLSSRHLLKMNSLALGAKGIDG